MLAALALSVVSRSLKAEVDPYEVFFRAENVRDSGLEAIRIEVTDEDHRAIASKVRKARSIAFTAHTGYNTIVLLYRRALEEAAEHGCQIRIVISDPGGPLLHTPELTRLLCPSVTQDKDILNVIEVCRSIAAKAPVTRDTEPLVQVKLYPGVPTINALMIDDWLRLTPYLPLLDAAEVPIFEFSKGADTRLFDIYQDVFTRQWREAHKCDLGRRAM